MIHKNLRVLLAAALAVSLSPLHALAITYHVSNDGNDAADGLTPSTSWETLAHAVPVVQPGDTVEVAPGSYVGFLYSHEKGGASGTPDAPITYHASGPGVKIVTGVPNGIPDTVPGGGGIYGIQVLDADYIIIDGFEVSGMSRAGISVEESTHVIVRNNTCADNGRWGIFTSFTDDCIIEHNECAGSQREHGIYYSNTGKGAIIRYNICHDNRNAGIHLNGDRTFYPKVRTSIPVTGIIDGAEIDHNLIYNNGTGGAAGINMDGAQDARIHDNLLYGNHAGGITCYGIDAARASQNAMIYNNTIIMASDGRAVIQFADAPETDTAATGGHVFNNILIHLGNKAVIEAQDKSRQGLVCEHNIVSDRFEANGSTLTLSAWQALGWDTTSQLAPALTDLFVDPASNDYHLKAGSIAIDAGSDAVSSLVTDDFDGNPRPSGLVYDVGAYEFEQTPTGSWAGSDVFNGYSDTGGWLGLSWVEFSPWIYSFPLRGWLYADPSAVDETGGWVFVPRS